MFKAYKAAGGKLTKAQLLQKLEKENLDDTKGTIIAVPNIILTKKELFALAKKFGEDQPYKTWIYEDLYNLYTDEELCGTATGGLVRFLCIPDKLTTIGTVAEQRELYKHDHVPTVFEAIVFWFTLREMGKPLNFDSTYIKHFDLPEKQLDGWSVVPSSYVNYDGEPVLSSSDVDDGYDARLAVGSKLEPQPLSSPLETPETNIKVNELVLQTINFVASRPGTEFTIHDRVTLIERLLRRDT